MKKKEKESEKILKRYVLENLKYYTKEELKELVEDPAGFLRVPYLFEIQTTYKIFKNGEHIGYAFECGDHVDSELIQDSSWVILYTDLEMNVVTEKEGTA